MDRRDLLKTSLTSAGALAVGSMLARTAFAGEPSDEAPTDALGTVVNTAAACIKAGEVCLAHCIKELSTCNTSMANCNRRVHEMLATCNAMLRLAAMRSDLARKFAALCAEACANCEAACAEHRAHWAHGMHLECKACFEACVECRKACLALAA